MLLHRPERSTHAAAALVVVTVGWGVLLLAAPAQAQSSDDIMRWLKPWVERQLFGEQPAEEEEPSAEMAEPEPPLEEGAAEAAGAEAEAPANATAAAGEGEAGAADGSIEAVEIPPPASAEGTGGAVTGAIAPTAEAEEQPQPAPEPEGPLPLRFAVIAGPSVSATIAAVSPIADEIGAVVGRPVEFLPMASFGAMVDAQVERRIDGGFFTASAYAFAEARCDCLEPIVAPRASDGTLGYYAIIVARNGSGIQSALDLEGKTVAIGAPDSLGARRMQLAGLMASGIDPASTFGGVVEVESANDAVRLLRDGGVDAAFAWSSLEGSVAEGYSRGTLSQLVAAGEIVMDRYAIVWRSSRITHGPFAVLGTLSEEEKDRIGSFFVGLDIARPAAYDLLNPYYSGGYAPVDPQDYTGLSALTAQNVDALALPLVAATQVSVPGGDAPAAE